MNNNLSDNFKGTTALIFAALFWGLEFVVEKDVLNHIEPNWSNAIRFFVASLVCLMIWKEKIKTSRKSDWGKGMLSGTIMGLGYAFQTMGLETINAGVNAFLCVAYIIIIPFMIWLIEKKRPIPLVFICAIIAIAGVTIMSGNDLSFSGVNLGKGEILTLIGSFFYAGGIVSVDYYAKSIDCFLFATIQCIATFAVSIILALFIETPPAYVNTTIILQFFYLIIFASIITQLLFTYGMKYVSSHKASILFLLESVSAVIFGFIFLKEQITLNHLIGASLIIISILLTNRSENQ